MTGKTHGTRPGEITGRTVLLCLLGFFGVVIMANVALVRAATSTFGGVETMNAYQAGLAFNREIMAAREQESRQWRVNGNVMRDAQGMARIDIDVRNAYGLALSGLAIEARLAHPTDARLDHVASVVETRAGLYRGVIEAEPGQWHFVIDIIRGDERMFRSTNRVILR